jgi:hypothetical protein
MEADIVLKHWNFIHIDRLIPWDFIEPEMLGRAKIGTDAISWRLPKTIKHQELSQPTWHALACQ